MPDVDPSRLNQGPKEPVAGTPKRQPGSIRRTSSFDGLHPDGPGGPTELVLRGRDLLTGADGRGEVLAETEVRLRLDGMRVDSVWADPAEVRLNGLIGAHPSRDWRKTVGGLLPDHRDDRTILYLLLDALPGWMGLSSFGLIDAPGSKGRPAVPPNAAQQALSLRADMCAGWQTGGTLLQLVADGRSGAGFARPPAPSLECDDDPLAWHELEPLAPYGSRRRRRVDVIGGRTLRIDGMFRDTSADAFGTEGVLHEYTVTAGLDPTTWQVTESSAVPRSLPYLECPQAAGSAAQLVGWDVRDLRRMVGREMRGPTTCTHLNELYRTLADVATLAGILTEIRPTSGAHDPGSIPTPAPKASM
jgi:hypothetical protein